MMLSFKWWYMNFIPRGLNKFRIYRKKFEFPYCYIHIITYMFFLSFWIIHLQLKWIVTWHLLKNVSRQQTNENTENMFQCSEKMIFFTVKILKIEIRILFHQYFSILCIMNSQIYFIRTCIIYYIQWGYCFIFEIIIW